MKRYARWNVDGEVLNIEDGYEVLGLLGSGAYGKVYSCKTSESKLVALKKCSNIFHSRTLAKRILRELRILRHVKHENVVDLLSLQAPASFEGFEDVYIVFEHMDTDLGDIVKSKQRLTREHIQLFSVQMLRGVSYLHSVGVVHRDLKPRNILVNANCLLKIADFGLSKVCTPENARRIPPMTEYVTTRWYRAPEILVGWREYSFPVDMWAVGTIIAELFRRSPLFPGTDSYHQLELIFEATGKPDQDFLDKCRKPNVRAFLEDCPHSKPLNPRSLFTSAGRYARDLLTRLLRIDPSERLTAQESLAHIYFSRDFDVPSYCAEDSAHTAARQRGSRSLAEMGGEGGFGFEGKTLDIADLRAEVIVEVNLHHPELKRVSGMTTSQLYPPFSAEEDLPPQETPTLSSGGMSLSSIRHVVASGMVIGSPVAVITPPSASASGRTSGARASKVPPSFSQKIKRRPSTPIPLSRESAKRGSFDPVGDTYSRVDLFDRRFLDDETKSSGNCDVQPPLLRTTDAPRQKFSVPDLPEHNVSKSRLVRRKSGCFIS